MWTGLVFPQYQPANSSSTVSDQSRIRQKRSTASASYDACSASAGKGVVIGTPYGSSRIRTSIPSRRRAPWSCSSKAATERPSASGKDSTSPRFVLTTSRWSTKSKSIWNVDAARRVHAPCRQPANVDVERRVPPVISRCRGRHPDLAHDLDPEVKRVLGRLPVLEREGGKLGPAVDRDGHPSAPGSTTNATSSTKHQLHSSPGSAERAIGWSSSAACLRAWRFGDASQQPILPQVMHMRRCTQRLPIFRHSSQPAIDDGSVVTAIRSRCVHIGCCHRLSLQSLRNVRS